MHILPGELAFIQTILQGLAEIAAYSPASTVQPVQIARDTMRKANALTFESEPLRREINQAIGSLPESLRAGMVPASLKE